MQITSTAFENNGRIPSKYTCEGENISPELVFLDIPTKARSLALICHDPDAPRAEGWTHWLLGNLHPMTQRLRENQPPTSGIGLTNDFGKQSYGGPCPPQGLHRYFFYLFALDSELKLDPSMGKKELEEAMEGHIIAQAELVGLYKRN